MDSTGFGQEPMAGSPQHGRDPLGSLKVEEFLDLLESQCQVTATPMHGVTSNMQDCRPPPRYS
jgi:hypothetical protein